MHYYIQVFIFGIYDFYGHFKSHLLAFFGFAWHIYSASLHGRALLTLCGESLCLLLTITWFGFLITLDKVCAFWVQRLKTINKALTFSLPFSLYCMIPFSFYLSLYILLPSSLVSYCIACYQLHFYCMKCFQTFLECLLFQWDIGMSFLSALLTYSYNQTMHTIFACGMYAGDDFVWFWTIFEWLTP